MEFPLAARLVPRLIAMDEVSSTNDELTARASDSTVPEFTVVATTTQTAGRGRLGRTWQAPPGTSLAVSILVRPQDAHLDSDLYGWLPLIAGLAMSRAVRALLPHREVSLKWPNDVLIDQKKVSGLLCELLPNGSVVVGAGVNLTIPEKALPVPQATSLMLMGVVGPAEELADLVLARYVRELMVLREGLAAGGDGESVRTIRNSVSEACSTLGQRIRLVLPGSEDVYGTALDLDDAGRLRFRRDEDGSVQAVAAGDVTHLRYE
ncbi:MAG: biotin--[acetyl-CoA-carboxylase] ligase [Terrimesophilobacter sp.]